MFCVLCTSCFLRERRQRRWSLLSGHSAVVFWGLWLGSEFFRKLSDYSQRSEMPCEGHRVTSTMRRKPPCALLSGKVLQELGTSRLEQLPKAHVWGLNLGSHACPNTGSLALLKFLPDSG